MNVYILQVMSILRQAYCSPKYLYYLLPGQEKQVRGADGSLHKEAKPGEPRSGNGKSVAAASVSAVPFVRLGFGVLVAIGLYLTYVGWLAKPPVSSVKNNP